MKILLLLILPIIIYLLIIKLFVKRSFNKVSDDIKSNINNFEINRYHNEAIYKSFEFYIKISIALITGIFALFFVVLSDNILLKNLSKENFSYLIKMSSLLFLVITFLFSSIILSHKWSKMRLWSRKPKTFDFLIWSDFWIISIANIISLYLFFSFRFVIVDILTNIKNVM